MRGAALLPLDYLYKKICLHSNSTCQLNKLRRPIQYSGRHVPAIESVDYLEDSQDA